MEGLALANELGLDMLELESDCKPLIDFLRQTPPQWHPLDQLLQDILVACSSFSPVNLSVVVQEGNWAAHWTIREIFLMD